MVARRHNLTRRALLGVGVAASAAFVAGARGRLPATVPIPRPATTTPTAALTPAAARRWSRALLAYRRAEAGVAVFRRAEAALPPHRRAFPASEALDARLGALESARLESLTRLLAAPAPDLPGLALKIDLALKSAAWELADAEPACATLRADAHRLAHAG